MKFFQRSTVLLLAMAMMLFACSPDNIGPSEGRKGEPNLAGSASDPHPVLDTVCQKADTMFLVREDDGSPVINKCYGPAGPRACFPSEIRPWGYLEMLEGYYGDSNYIDCNFTMAPGWFCNRNDWEFSIASNFQFDQNGIPLVTSDWASSNVIPNQNRWQLRISTTILPDPCYDVALRVGANKLNLFGAVVPGSYTVLWGKNRNWNVQGNPAQSISPWLQRFCPLRCREQAPIPVDSSCVAFYSGISQLACTNIAANTTGLSGTLSYEWSTGATTSSISVCPTATTDYSVTISSNGAPVLINLITVNYVDAACGNGNGNNGIHKVWVCHVPPGNPSNVQDICIDWSALPAHIERFRAPGSNPNQGHDSGCEIGRCGSNPCL